MATSVVGQLRPKWHELSAKASELEAARGPNEARAAVDDQNKRLRPIVDALRPLNEGDRKVLASIVADVSRKIQADRAAKDSPARPGTPGSQVKPRPGQRLQPVSLEQRTYGLLSQPSGSR